MQLVHVVTVPLSFPAVILFKERYRGGIRNQGRHYGILIKIVNANHPKVRGFR